MIATVEQLNSLPRDSQERLARIVQKKPTILDQFWIAPWKVMEVDSWQADPWQKDALCQLVTRRENTLMCCSRGAGKSETLAATAYLEACLGGFPLVFSRSDRQAKEEIFDRVIRYHEKWHLVPEKKNYTTHDLQLANGGRVLALPCSAVTTVGKHKVTLLIIDEAAKVSDPFYAMVTPMIAIQKILGERGRIALLSTPFGQRGFFWREWTGKGRKNWRRHKYPWTTCPRITIEHIREEELSHGKEWVEQEYSCCFQQAIGSAYRDIEGFAALIDSDQEIIETW